MTAVAARALVSRRSGVSCYERDDEAEEAHGFLKPECLDALNGMYGEDGFLFFPLP